MTSAPATIRLRSCRVSLRPSASSAGAASADRAVGDVPRQPAAHRQHRRQGRPGERRVLWALKSQDHFIASPVPVGDRLFVSGLGRVQPADLLPPRTPTPKATERVAGSKSTPYLKLPSVSSPGRRRRPARLRRRHAPDRRRHPPLPRAPTTACRSGSCRCRATWSTWKARRPSPTAASTSAAGRPASSASSSTRRTLDGKELDLAAIAEDAGREVEGAADEVRGGRRRRTRLRRAADRRTSCSSRARRSVWQKGEDEVARRRPGERRRRQGAGRDGVPRQGEGRRAGAVTASNAKTGDIGCGGSR